MEVQVNSAGFHHVLCCQDGTFQAYEQELVEEEPLLIRVEGHAYSVVMRTPGEENFHAAGFCLAEGLVDELEDIATIGYCDQVESSMVSVTLQPARRKKVENLLQRRGFVSQTSCGICGKEMIRDLCQILAPVTDKSQINVRQALECADELPRHQRLYKKTGGSHAAMIFDRELHVLAVSEDVGRHNALDKAIGKVFLGGKLQDVCLAVLSSRISYELVQKAARARLPILISLSRPTALAVELGKILNMTLACPSREGRLCVFCGEEALLEG